MLARRLGGQHINFSIARGLANNSDALAITAAGTRPARCALRPASLRKASKIAIPPERLPGGRRESRQLRFPGQALRPSEPPHLGRVEGCGTLALAYLRGERTENLLSAYCTRARKKGQPHVYFPYAD